MTVKIGFIGCGGIASAHMKALAEIEDAQIVACMDIDADKAAQAAVQFAGVSSYADVREMLDAHELDAAYVCVIPSAHGDIELALIERDIPFLVEKPIAHDRETPLRILEALDGKDLITSVGYMFRYRENVARAKAYLAEDTPVIARGAWLGGMPGVMWWRQKHMSGGQAMEQTTHVFDLARYLLGEVTSVFCRGRTGLITGVEAYDVEDASICTLTFESGMLCEISSSCALKMGEVSLEIFTQNGSIRLSDWALNLELSTQDKKEVLTSTEDIFRVEDEAFVSAVESGSMDGIRSPYADAVKTQMVVCAANESIASGKAVSP